MRIERPATSKRNGSLTIELLLVTPILVSILAAIVVFGSILVVQQVLTTASREGARVKAVGGTNMEVETAVKAVLGTGRLANASNLKIIQSDDGTNVTVTVSVPTNEVVPDALKNFGLSFENITLAATTVMKKE